MTAIGEGLKLAFALFAARNSAAMQDGKRAQTIAKIKASVNEHISSGNLQAVRDDGTA